MITLRTFVFIIGLFLLLLAGSRNRDHENSDENQDYLIKSLLQSDDSSPCAPSKSTSGKCLFGILPHLRGDQQLLLPKYRKGFSREKRQFVIGIPTVRRQKESYIIKTIHSVISGLAEVDWGKVRIIVMVTDIDEKFARKTCRTLEDIFYTHIRSGLLEIIHSHSGFYPVLDDLSPLAGESPQDAKWRVKQVLDYSYLMLYARPLGKYYLQLEDDVTATSYYLPQIEKFLNEIDTHVWVTLKFSSLGLLGNLFRSTEISPLARFLLTFYAHRTLEELFDEYVKNKYPGCSEAGGGCVSMHDLGSTRILHRPSLFQHIGHFSSRPGTIFKNVSDLNYPVGYERYPWLEVPIYMNPPAKITTSLKSYRNHTLEGAYRWEEHYYALQPQNGDTIHFRFTPPVTIEEFFLRTGNGQYNRAVFKPSVYVDILPMFPKRIDISNNYHFKYRTLPDGYVTVARFNSRGVAEGPLGDSFGKIKSVRLRVTEDHDARFIVLRHMTFKLQLVPSTIKPCCEGYWADPYPKGIPGADFKE